MFFFANLSDSPSPEEKSSFFFLYFATLLFVLSALMAGDAFACSTVLVILNRCNLGAYVYLPLQAGLLLRLAYPILLTTVLFALPLAFFSRTTARRKVEPLEDVRVLLVKHRRGLLYTVVAIVLTVTGVVLLMSDRSVFSSRDTIHVFRTSYRPMGAFFWQHVMLVLTLMLPILGCVVPFLARVVKPPQEEQDKGIQ